MIYSFESTGLWGRSLGTSGTNEEEKSGTERLRAVYQGFRKRVAQLTERIATALPNLTVHDVTHLDALWETADLIAGTDYPLNPIEGFVLAGAILLHDSALCFEAYEKGADGLRETLQWKDAYAAAKQRSAHISDSDLRSEADFAALRELHAVQAGILGVKAWKTPEGDDLFLIDDSDIRARLGKLIGEIASSHHWSIEDVQARLRNQVNALTSFPRNWRVDPIKIALLLRCADAAHIDERRAPDFVRALANRQGISADHWTAQNWLGRADIDQSVEEGTAILITSLKDFEKKDASAWWLAYDAVNLIDAEIKSSNRLLDFRNRPDSPPFKVKTITGSCSPEILRKHIQAHGWTPCAAKIHVANIEQLVKDLGGATLYGTQDQLGVVLRELIQNARDAIAARREISSDTEYNGKIKIIAYNDGNGESVIEITDDGIGMSERVLTGPLLEFGTSFWISDLVKHEFPGLRSSAFRSVGKFGIGFYSVFMVASKVDVTSRRWDGALTEAMTMSFPNGLTLRPIFSTGHPHGFEASTVVALRLLKPLASGFQIEVTSGRLGVSNFLVSFEHYISAIAVGLDVDVHLKVENGVWKTVHKRIDFVTTTPQRRDWLERMSFSKYLDPNARTYISDNVDRLRPLFANGKQCGLAAISTHPGLLASLGRRTIGGLPNGVNNISDESFIGYLDYKEISAKRDTSNELIAPKSAMQEWGADQIEMLNAAGIDLPSRSIATVSLCQLDIDPSKIFTCMLLKSGMQ